MRLFTFRLVQFWSGQWPCRGGFGASGTSGVSADHVTYTPTLTSSGTVDIYAKWMESATRAQAVPYIVQEAGGPLSQPGF